jgi:periplasmic protein TonB
MERKHKIITQPLYYRLLMSTLFIVIGTMLFCCQNKDEKKQKTEKIETVSNPSAAKSDLINETSTNKNSVKISSPQKNDSDKSVNQKENNNLKSEKTSIPSKKAAEETVEKSPTKINAEFPGGIDQFHSFFMKEFKKPENVSYWKLNLNLAFAVEKNGSVSFLECSPAVEEPLQKEIIRVLSLCPKWQPGESNGKKIKMQYSVPILLK